MQLPNCGLDVCVMEHLSQPQSVCPVLHFISYVSPLLLGSKRRNCLSPSSGSSVGGSYPGTGAQALFNSHRAAVLPRIEKELGKTISLEMEGQLGKIEWSPPDLELD